MIYRFEGISLDTESLELRRGDETVPVEPQVFSLLVHLITNRDRVVGKGELIAAVWDGRAISDSALNSRINAARKAVGDNGETQAVIKTFPRRGFRFVGDVKEGPVAGTSGNDAIASLAGKPSIAVLPFANMSGDLEQEYFVDGFTEDIITALSRIRRFHIIARNTTFTYKGKWVNVQALARDLGVRYVLEGSVRKIANRVRISAHLIAADGQSIWSESYDRELEDVFRLQDELSMKLAAAIAPALSAAELHRVLTKKPENLDVWDLYLRGLWHVNRRNSADAAKAAELFMKAMEKDPNFGPAFSGYAWAFQITTLFGFARMDEAVAKSAALRAISLDSDDPFARFSLGQIYYIERNHEAAIDQFRSALRLNPGFTDAHHRLAFTLTHAGEPEQAIQHLDNCLQLSPNEVVIGVCYAGYNLAYLYMREFRKAVAWGQRALRQPFIPWPGYAYLIAALAQSGEVAEAKTVLEKLLALRPDISMSFVMDRTFTTDMKRKDLLLNGLRMAGFPD